MFISWLNPSLAPDAEFICIDNCLKLSLFEINVAHFWIYRYTTCINLNVKGAGLGACASVLALSLKLHKERG